jgi:hypothetical protein
MDIGGWFCDDGTTPRKVLHSERHDHSSQRFADIRRNEIQSDARDAVEFLLNGAGDSVISTPAMHR